MDASAGNWPEIRMRYVLRHHMTDAQRAALQTATHVSFVPMEAVGEYGGLDIGIIRQKDEVETGYTLFFDGDVVVAKITPCFENGKGAVANGLHNGIAYGTTELHVLSPDKRLDAHFLFYVTISDSFRVQGEAAMKGAAGQKRVTDEFIQNFTFRLPPIDVQKSIVEYLDLETSQIDQLIVEKEQMLSLLEEKRSALVSSIVTRGLDPNVRMKPSGLEWLGEVPEHWDVLRAKQLFAVRDERSESGDEELLTVSHITGVTRRADKDVNMFKSEDMTGYKRCEAGDLITNTLWAWMGAMGVASEPGIVSPDYHVYAPTGGLISTYIEALCRSKPFVAEVTSRSKGVWSSRLRLYPEAFLDIRLPVPPITEQEEIVEALKHEQRRSAEFESTLRASIALLKERRSALITAAVTGQLHPEGIPA